MALVVLLGRDRVRHSHRSFVLVRDAALLRKLLLQLRDTLHSRSGWEDDPVAGSDFGSSLFSTYLLRRLESRLLGSNYDVSVVEADPCRLALCQVRDGVISRRVKLILLGLTTVARLSHASLFGI